MVERPAVWWEVRLIQGSLNREFKSQKPKNNREVVGSSPTAGAKTIVMRIQPQYGVCRKICLANLPVLK